MPVLKDGTIVDEKGNPTGQRVDLDTNEVSGTSITSASLSATPSFAFAKFAPTSFPRKPSGEACRSLTRISRAVPLVAPSAISA